MNEIIRHIDNLFTNRDKVIKKYVEERTQSLVLRSNALEILEVTINEKPIFDGMIGGYLAAKWGGFYPKNDLNRDAFDRLSLVMKNNVAEYLKLHNEIGKPFSNSRIELLNRAANLATSTYINSPANGRADKVRKSIISAKKSL